MPAASAGSKKIEQQKSGGKRKHTGKGDLRDLLGKKFGMTGRNLELLEEVLDTPEVVQWAVAKKLVPLHTARKIAQLPAEKQAELAIDISEWKEADGMDEQRLKIAIKGVVKQCLSEASDKSKTGTKRASRVTRDVTAMNKSLVRIARELEKKPRLRLSVSLPKLKEAHGTLARLIEKAEARNPA